eukprot:scaffold74768_cov42-Prasinocladus_malaysianus.AAC.1
MKTYTDSARLLCARWRSDPEAGKPNQARVTLNGRAYSTKQDLFLDVSAILARYKVGEVLPVDEARVIAQLVEKGH